MDNYQEYSNVLEAAQACRRDQSVWRIEDSDCDVFVVLDNSDDLGESEAKDAAIEWAEGGTYDEDVVVTVRWSRVAGIDQDEFGQWVLRVVASYESEDVAVAATVKPYFCKGE